MPVVSIAMSDDKSKSVKLKSKKKASGSVVDPHSDEIVIDEAGGLVFSSEEKLLEYFQPTVDVLEKKLFNLHSDKDIPVKDYCKYEKYLNETLDYPDEVWEDSSTVEGVTVNHFVAKYEEEGRRFIYVVTAYLTNDLPTFVYLHFPTQDIDVLDKYCVGDLIFDQDFEQVEFATLEGDALGEGDMLSVGLFQAMLTLRSDNDLPDEDYRKFSYLRQSTIESADEIWRSTDLSGNILVYFIKDHPDEGVEDLHYIVATQEDEESNVHALLFSFPTKDKSLVDRYRHGENLQAEEVHHESSH